jgi:Sec-independent protein translocase protein TatA
MDVFNIGTGELLVLVLLALLLFGPEEAIKAGRTIGQTVQKGQQMWRQFSALLQHDLLEVERAERPQPYSDVPRSQPTPPPAHAAEPAIDEPDHTADTTEVAHGG